MPLTRTIIAATNWPAARRATRARASSATAGTLEIRDECRRSVPVALSLNRHPVIGAFANLVRPTLGDGFQTRVKTNALRSMHVMIAEQGPLPAAERVEGHRDRNGNVDADHARLHLAGECLGGGAVARKDSRAIAVFVIVD